MSTIYVSIVADRNIIKMMTFIYRAEIFVLAVVTGAVKTTPNHLSVCWIKEAVARDAIFRHIR